MAKAQTYGEAHEKATAMLSQARLADPHEHFPYKIDDVLELIDSDPAMGPGIPGNTDGDDDRSREVADYITADIAQASAAYVDAQAAYLTDPGDTTRDAYDAARDRLVAARLDHRQNRTGGFIIGAAARRAG